MDIILENEMTENESYQKMSIVKVIHLNLYFQIKKTKIQMILLKSNLGLSED